MILLHVIQAVRTLRRKHWLWNGWTGRNVFIHRRQF